jgi:hypothetical protein
MSLYLSMRRDVFLANSKRPVDESMLPGKDINLAATNDELNAAIVSLTAMIKNQKDLLSTTVATKDQWVQRVDKVERLLHENEIEPFLTTVRKKELEDLLSRAQGYVRSSAFTAEELASEINTCEKHLEAAQEAKNKISLLLVTKKLELFPLYGIESADRKADYATSREIRSVIATAQALISLREGN